jgi:hypothetical protein
VDSFAIIHPQFEISDPRKVIMAITEEFDGQNNVSDLTVCAFALTDCTVHVEWQSAKYLRAVHRTALELAVPNLFGAEIGGYWLKSDQIDQLRQLPDCYPANESDLVRRAVETYLLAQIEELDWLNVDE